MRHSVSRVSCFAKSALLFLTFVQCYRAGGCGRGDWMGALGGFQGLPPGYRPRIPVPEPETETGFTLLGYGACRTANQTYLPWGASGGINEKCAAKCTADPTCLAYMSTQDSEAEPSDRGSCQFYCVRQSTGGGVLLCPNPGTAWPGEKITTTDGTQEGSRVRYCWRRTP